MKFVLYKKVIKNLFKTIFEIFEIHSVNGLSLTFSQQTYFISNNFIINYKSDLVLIARNRISYALAHFSVARFIVVQQCNLTSIS